ncbi:HAMP domain-containing histidine kinase [Antarcticibacterium sp. 1MA-6-2]|uniref:sensor histidine kinase n=1 Tax=Antarcticibacterium sp. 1MA-6-2 TaxID=2908210 RepID=UPI001F1D751E|nr:HAMP domain-containing sensor histidine kinase [Antarcticibacterium sp. 1MA-6-2]UJH92624.1 HAMP domain-containing histidine kinase [Antarcticibacterium sp. 1MA-6-2]
MLLSQLKSFKIQDNKKPEFQPTPVDEFNLLNSRINKFISKAQESYKSQKEFIENASHEMQTPLAIALNNLEQLLETEGLGREHMELIEKTMGKLESLTRYNKSLLLLSRIQNEQFPEQEKVEVNHILKNLIEDFKDISDSKNVEIRFTEHASIELQMNQELAQIIFTNLLKNAIIHSPEGGIVEVEVTSSSVCFSNSGDTPLDENSIFTRFYRSGSQVPSNGLGLAIARAIAESYKLQLHYNYSEGHIFRIHI